MQVMDEAYSNFVNSINSDQTRRLYEYSLSKFLKSVGIDPGFSSSGDRHRSTRTSKNR